MTCTCGTSLPEDARFCYRCGKPQREELFQPPFEPPVVRAVERPMATAPPARSRITFSNPLVMRIALFVASLSTVLEMIQLGILIVPLLGGFASVWIYQKRAGLPLGPGGGAKLAWITSVLNTVLLTILLAVEFAISGSAIWEPLRRQATTPQQKEVIAMLNQPAMLTLVMLFVWLFLFAFLSAMYAAGGALGSRFAKRSS